MGIETFNKDISQGDFQYDGTEKGKKVWICLSTRTNGMSTGYFSSVVKDIKAHVVAFILCPAAQVYWTASRKTSTNSLFHAISAAEGDQIKIHQR
jgi:hypothetical protein